MSVQTISTRSQTASKMSARTRDRLLNVISPLALLVLWELCARFGFIDTRFFPAPSSVVSTMIDMLRTGELVTHTAVSMQRLLYGAILGGVPALVLGIAMGLNRPIRALFDPLIAATYPVPKSAILPLALLIFGLGEAVQIDLVDFEHARRRVDDHRKEHVVENFHGGGGPSDETTKPTAGTPSGPSRFPARYR